LNVSPFRILQQIIFVVCFVSVFSVQATQPVGHTGTGTQPTHESLYWEYQGRALLQHPWKVVKNDLAQEDSYELYNLTDDLSETKNIAAAHPEIVAEMSAKLDEIWKDRKKKETLETK
jgi:arylsulfatase A-like enzyme